MCIRDRYTTKNLAPYKKFAFTNNIVYSKTPYVGQILNWGLQTDFTEGNLTAIISNNTVINIAGNNPYFRHNKGSLTMTKNIFYVDSSFAKNSNLYTYVGNDTHPVSVTTVDAVSYTHLDVYKRQLLLISIYTIVL